jgi:hypothetical protein
VFRQVVGGWRRQAWPVRKDLKQRRVNLADGVCRFRRPARIFEFVDEAAEDVAADDPSVPAGGRAGE